jgi:hypothetical protein
MASFRPVKLRGKDQGSQRFGSGIWPFRGAAREQRWAQTWVPEKFPISGTAIVGVSADSGAAKKFEKKRFGAEQFSGTRVRSVRRAKFAPQPSAPLAPRRPSLRGAFFAPRHYASDNRVSAIERTARSRTEGRAVGASVRIPPGCAAAAQIGHRKGEQRTTIYRGKAETTLSSTHGQSCASACPVPALRTPGKGGEKFSSRQKP